MIVNAMRVWAKAGEHLGLRSKHQATYNFVQKLERNLSETQKF